MMEVFLWENFNLKLHYVVHYECGSVDQRLLLIDSVQYFSSLTVKRFC